MTTLTPVVKTIISDEKDNTNISTYNKMKKSNNNNKIHNSKPYDKNDQNQQPKNLRVSDQNSDQSQIEFDKTLEDIKLQVNDLQKKNRIERKCKK
jgi:hypothetical protein